MSSSTSTFAQIEARLKRLSGSKTLKRVRDDNLYKEAGYKTFEDYRRGGALTNNMPTS